MNISLHANPPAVSVYHVNSVADPLMAFPLWNSKMTRLVNSLGTMMTGTTEYHNLTAFLRVLFSPRMKSGSGMVSISFTLLLQKLSHPCSPQSMLRFSLSLSL